MKHDWEYKKLGEVGTIITGSTPPTSNPKNYESKDICFVKPSDIEKEGITHISKAENYISNYAYNNSCRRLPKGSVLITCIGIIGKVGILEVDATCNQQINALVPKEELSSKYIAYALLSIKELMQSVANAPVVPIINKGQFSSFCIPLPPLSIQEQIVSELDKVSEIIEKKKQQMKELDNLAQSIFYDMFGDPVENEKGWEVKTFGEIGELQRGSGLSKKDLVESGYPCILYGQIHTHYGAYTKQHITSIPKELVKTAKIAHTGDLIMAITSEDVEGSCKSTAWMGDYDIAIGSDAAIYRHSQNGIYVSYYTRTKAFYHEKEKYARGFKVTHISTKEIATIPIMLPPIALQQAFAEKIEVIEKQKELITASIKEAQTLFDARMEYWFGE